MAKRALVIGASGLTGSALVRTLEAEGWAVTGTAMSRPRHGLRALDLADAAAVSALIHELAPNVVFLAAAFTHVDGCEDDPVRARRINVDGPRACATACQAIGGVLVFFSSGHRGQRRRGANHPHHRRL